MRLLIAQIVLVLAVAAALFFQDAGMGYAALYGGAIAIGNTLLLLRRMRRANTELAKDPNEDVRSLYAGAVERFVFTLGAMIAGMGWIRLDPMALLIGFAVAYLGHPFSRFVPFADAAASGGDKKS